jgi:SAM-dependent methyltransferase
MPSAPDDHFSSIADAYVRGRFGYPEELFGFLADRCERRECAWDCATGSGQALRPLAERFQQVIATDISAALLERAPRLSNVSYKVAAAEHAPLSDKSVDLITVAQALHWFDLDAFWPEVRRVLRPGGVFCFWGYTWPLVDVKVDAILTELRATLLPYWPKQSALLHAGYAEVAPPFSAIASPPMKATASWTSADYLAHLVSWSAVRYCRERSAFDLLLTFEQRLREIWGDGAARQVHWPLVVRTFRV